MITATILVAAAGTAVGIVAIIGLIAAALAGGGGGGGAQPKFRDPPIDGPGTGPINPGPNNQGPKPTVPGPGGSKGWGGGQYGNGPIPGDFDWNGNLVYISEDCKTIAEPLLFLPIPGSHQILFWWMPTGIEEAQEGLEAALFFIGPPRDWPGNQPARGTAWGYIAYLVHELALTPSGYSAELVATEILAHLIEMNGADCGDIADTKTWSPALQKFFDNLVLRIKYGVKAIQENYDWYPDDALVPFNP